MAADPSPAPTPQPPELTVVQNHGAEAGAASPCLLDSSNKSISSNDDEKSLKTASFGKAGINLK